MMAVYGKKLDIKKYLEVEKWIEKN